MGNINSRLNVGIKIVGALLAVAYLTACGSSISGGGFGSVDNSSTSTPVIPGAAVAKCSQDVGTSSDFHVRVEAAYDQFGTIQPSYARVTITSAPTNWTNNYDLQLYRWTASSTGTTQLDQAALTFQFERTVAPKTYQLMTVNNGSNQQVAYSYSIIDANEITAYANASTGNSYASASAVFSSGIHFLVNLHDPSGSYQVIQAVLFNKGTRTVYRQVDVLIPTFYANPATYNSTHPAVLQNLHPLHSMGQGWSESQYQSFTDGLCF
jgi:hypothetical protein